MAPVLVRRPSARARRCKPDFLADVKSGKRKDVSIGFFYDFDETPGDWNGEKYDFVQRNILIDHLAAGVPVGRCPSPYCGISVDSFVRKLAADPWEETEDYIRSGHKQPSDTCRTIIISEEEGIKAVYCQYGDKWDIQSYLFAKANGWTLEKAKAWFEQHKQEADAEWNPAYINNLPDSCFAYVEEGDKKDDEGKTVPRSLRHLPFKNAAGEVDHDHLVNALARVKQAGTMPEGGKREAVTKLCSAVKSWNTSHPDSKIQSEVCGTQDSDEEWMRLLVFGSSRELERSRKLLSQNISHQKVTELHRDDGARRDVQGHVAK